MTETRKAIDAWSDIDFEVRAAAGGLRFEGYAAVFDARSADLGGFTETIAPNAFAVSLSERGQSNRNPIKMFLNHDWGIPLASTYRPAGREPTLRLSEDSRGLHVDADLPDNEWGRPVRDAIQRGDISSMSFGFTVPRGGDKWNESRTERRLERVALREVSPITAWPAYVDTNVSVRRLAEAVDLLETDLDDALRALLTVKELTPEHRDTLIRAINARSPSPVVDQEVAELRARLLARRPSWLEDEDKD